MIDCRDLRDDRGATAVEYGLIAALVAVVILVAIVLLGGNLSGLFTNAASSVTGSTQAGSGGGGGAVTTQPLGAGAPGSGTCTSGDKSGTYECTMSLPASIEGVAVSYSFDCDGDCTAPRLTWSSPTLSLSGWGNGRAADVVIEWGFPGSSGYQPETGSIELSFT